MIPLYYLGEDSRQQSFVEEFEDVQELQQGGSEEKNSVFSYNSLFKNQRFKGKNR